MSFFKKQRWTEENPPIEIKRDKSEEQARIERLEKAREYCDRIANRFEILEGAVGNSNGKDVAKIYRELGKLIDETLEVNGGLRLNRDLIVKYSIGGAGRMIWDDIETLCQSTAPRGQEVENYIEERCQAPKNLERAKMAEERQPLLEKLGITESDLDRLKALRPGREVA